VARMASAAHPPTGVAVKVVVHGPCPDGCAAAALCLLAGVVESEADIIPLLPGPAQTAVLDCIAALTDPTMLLVFDISPDDAVLAAAKASPHVRHMHVGDHHITSSDRMHAALGPYGDFMTLEWGDDGEAVTGVTLAA
jgi:hypothetical protein